MNQQLETFAKSISLSSPENERLRLEFGYACAKRIEHLLEEPEVVECLGLLGKYLEGTVDASVLARAQKDADRLANQHRGSKSIDGCGHAAVSASYAIANAVNGKAIQAASYAAYAMVYADGGYGAVAQREAFDGEFSWQLNKLAALSADSIAEQVQSIF